MFEYLLLFLIANSFFLTIFPLILLQHTYESLTEFEKEQSRVTVSTLNIIIPIALGILFPIMYSLLRSVIPRKVSGMYLRFNLAGALSALIISVVIDNLFGIYDLWFDSNPYTMHVTVFVVYFLLFQLIGIWLYKKISEIFMTPPVSTKSLSPPSAPSIRSVSSSRRSQSRPPSVSSRSTDDSVQSSMSDNNSSRSSKIFDRYANQN